MKFFKDYIYPIAIFSGSIIGVGYLALPYLTLKVGIIPMLFHFVALTALVVYLHVIFSEISLKTPDFKRFPGFVGFHLGKGAKTVALFLIIFGNLGILLAYLIIGSQFLTSIFLPVFGSSLLIYVLIYFFILSAIIYFDGKTISKIEFWALSLLIILLAVVFIKGLFGINPDSIIENLRVVLWSSNVGKATLFLPFGPIIFSLWGTGLIPEIEEMLRGRKSLLKKVIIWGTIIPAVFYLLFIFLILGISGVHTTDSALIGLKNFLGPNIVSIALFIGFITTFTAFITQGLFLKKVFMYDMGVKHLPAWLLTCLTPLILFLLGFNSFIPIISFIGGVLLGIDGILILLMYRKIGGKSIIIYPLTLMFVLGIIYQLFIFK